MNQHNRDEVESRLRAIAATEPRASFVTADGRLLSLRDDGDYELRITYKMREATVYGACFLSPTKPLENFLAEAQGMFEVATENMNSGRAWGEQP